MTKKLHSAVGDIFGGFASMLVALPSAIAFGIIIYAPLGPGFAVRGALSGIIGTVVIGLIAPVAGGTPKLISAPCAPAAAVLSAFIINLLAGGSGATTADIIPSLIVIVAALCGLIQAGIGLAGGGRFIKYIPFSVVSGYLSGVGLLIILGQLPKLLGLGNGTVLWQVAASPGLLQWKGLLVGCTAMLAMLLALRFIRMIPATIISLASALAVYWILASQYPEMASLQGNAMVVGEITGGLDTFAGLMLNSWKNIGLISFTSLAEISVTAVTLSVLLSIDTLKTCLVLDVITKSRHDSNRELVGQGLANLGSAISCGIPGAGVMGATLVNIGSGAKTRFSRILAGIFSLVVLLFFGGFIAWVPLPALAGILIVIGLRMIDLKSFALLRHRSTRFDFVVYAAVVITALVFNLIAAAGMGIVLSILIFLRDQSRQHVIRRKLFGTQIFSKKRRLPAEREIMERRGGDILVMELQGPLFFGTADQLMTELEPYLARCKYMLLDMRRVHTVDYTAVHRLDQIEQMLGANGGTLIITSVPLSLPTGQNVQKYLKYLGLSQSGRSLRFFDDLDSGLQWAEERILESEKICRECEDLPLTLADFGIFTKLDAPSISVLLSCMTEKQFKPGEKIFSLGDPGREIYFIRKGTIRIYLPLTGGMIEHLATFGKGDFIGEMAFIVKGGRSANAVAEDDVSLYIMSRSAFDGLAKRDPRIGEIMFESLAAALTERLRQNHLIIKTLIEC